MVVPDVMSQNQSVYIAIIRAFISPMSFVFNITLLERSVAIRMIKRTKPTPLPSGGIKENESVLNCVRKWA